MPDQLNVLDAFAQDNEINITNTQVQVDETAPAIISLPSPRDALPPIRSLGYFLENPPEPPSELITGILHQGSKLILGGSSKSYKTWSLIDLAVSVAGGTQWWGWETTQKKVIYLNLEVQEAFFWSRVQSVCRAKSIEAPVDTFDIWNLRGYAEDIDKLITHLTDRTENEDYGLIVVDPVYKLMGARDENSAGDIGTLMNALERLAVRSDAAVVFGAHFAKGNAASKDSIDRISGSGVFARDPDTILTLTKHDEEDCYTVDPILRNFAPVESFVVKWEFPLMTRQACLDPKKLKNAGGSPKRFHAEDLLTYLQEPRTVTDWKREAMNETGMSDRTFQKLKKELVDGGGIIQENNNWVQNVPVTPIPAL